MMQTLIYRAEAFLKNALPVAEQPRADGEPAATAPGSQQSRASDPLPQHEESFYWALHAHW
ncbi:hypothetical protein FY036_08910 [Mesorhizobium microcysteis]|uniref:Uncharacterized protein n=1 Tax=Neoaquamicrobium microcysteis TaxID=2682781 RepID=A0A5D4GY12_9HYPH|nr:hypothetical protein [Mesorhizobium microcysteis]TYR33167.1 hypothetical protein FY036_08910 [Mesorhizobium microcysteis]